MKISRRIYRTGLWLATGFVVTVILAVGLVDASGQTAPPTNAKTSEADRKLATKYVGMWVTPDGSIRHELLANGRYDEARGNRKSAYRGRYEIRGNHIKYWDDTGFSADGTFVSDDELHHAGMVFRRAC
ncbi:MAG: hypothetical protein HC774_06940 [Sphingomonadales bacterium]|nr:hypothetical protein [Sphingomonadales bacterium]